MAKLTEKNVRAQFSKLSISPIEKVGQWLGDIEQDNECLCWNAEYTYCRIDCMLQLTQENKKLCQCNRGSLNSAVIAKDCASCQQELRSKRNLVIALTQSCHCSRDNYRVVKRSGDWLKVTIRNGGKKASECETCRGYVEFLLEGANYPACNCKDKNSTDLLRCRPFCKWRVNDFYRDWFERRREKLPKVTVWKKAEQQVLPTCECWEPFKRAECLPDCSKQLSQQCYALYEEACPCNMSAIHKIADEYCWVFRCAMCSLNSRKQKRDHQQQQEERQN